MYSSFVGRDPLLLGSAPPRRRDSPMSVGVSWAREQSPQIYLPVDGESTPLLPDRGCDWQPSPSSGGGSGRTSLRSASGRAVGIYTIMLGGDSVSAVLVCCYSFALSGRAVNVAWRRKGPVTIQCHETKKQRTGSNMLLLRTEEHRAVTRYDHYFHNH